MSPWALKALKRFFRVKSLRSIFERSWTQFFWVLFCKNEACANCKGWNTTTVIWLHIHIGFYCTIYNWHIDYRARDGAKMHVLYFYKKGNATTQKEWVVYRNHNYGGGIKLQKYWKTKETFGSRTIRGKLYTKKAKGLELNKFLKKKLNLTARIHLSRKVANLR